MTWESALNQAESFSDSSFIVSIPEDALILEKMVEVADTGSEMELQRYENNRD